MSITEILDLELNQSGLVGEESVYVVKLWVVYKTRLVGPQPRE